MTASELQAEAARAAQDTAHYEGLTAQAELMGTVARAETYGLPETVPHLIAKLRLLPPELLALITRHEETEDHE